MISIEERLASAFSALDQGRWSEARDLFAAVLAARPDHADARQFHGYCLCQLGDTQAGLLDMRRAVELAPMDAVRRVNLGITLTNLGENGEAISALERATRLAPRLAAGHVALGDALRLGGRLNDAIAAYRRGIKLDPSLSAARANLAWALLEKGNVREAVEQCQAAVDAAPGCVEAWFNLGVGRKRLGDLPNAADAYRAALKLRPGFAEAANNLGGVLLAMGDETGAAHAYGDAIAANPRFADARFNLGAIRHQQGELADAIEHYRAALALRPEHPETLENLAAALKAHGELAESIEHFRAASRRKSDPATAYYSLANALVEAGDESGANDAFVRATAARSDAWLWKLRAKTVCPLVFPSRDAILDYRDRVALSLRDFDRAGPIDLSLIATSGAEPSFNWPFHGMDDRPLKERYARLFVGKIPRVEAKPAGGAPRVGIVVADGSEKLFARSMLNVFERFGPEPRLTLITSKRGAAELRKLASGERFDYLPLDRDFRAAAESIARAGFSLLYFWEIGVESLSYFLPFARLAPVQVTSWGIQVTSGIPEMDAYLSSREIEPADAQTHYSERLVLLDTLLTSQPPRPTPSPRDRASFSLKSQERIYLCAQNLGKFHPDFDEVLSMILDADPEGRVVITAGRQAQAATALRQRFERAIPAAARITFLPSLEMRDYLALVAMADVALDPLYFGGVNTTYDALWFGTPIVTLPGAFQRGRYTLGCYRRIGIEDAVVETSEDYARVAVELAQDSDKRRDLSERILARRESLFDDAKPAEELESTFRRLIEQSGPR